MKHKSFIDVYLISTIYILFVQVWKAWRTNEWSDRTASEWNRKYQVRSDRHGREGSVSEWGAGQRYPGTAGHSGDQDVTDGTPGCSTPTGEKKYRVSQ